VLHRLQVVVDDDHRLSVVAQLAQDIDDGALGGRVDAGHRLVEEIDIGFLDQRAGEEDALLLAAGELADLAVGIVLHADLRQGVHRLVAFGAAGAAQPAEMAVEPHRHDIEGVGREIPVDAGALRHIADLAALAVIGAAVDADMAGGRGDEAEDRLDQRRLAGAVRADDRRHDAGRDVEIDVPQHRLGVIADRQVLDMDGKARFVQRVRHGQSPIRPPWRGPTARPSRKARPAGAAACRQGRGDIIGVFVDHADIGAAGGAFFAHGVGIELGADLDPVPCRDAAHRSPPGWCAD
jgi:hypothetical protein